MTKRKALGSGLEALLSAKPVNKNAQTPQTDNENSNQRILSIPVDKITRNKDQPRQVFFNESLESMASSIKENGQLAPIIVRKGKENIRRRTTTNNNSKDKYKEKVNNNK